MQFTRLNCKSIIFCVCFVLSINKHINKFKKSEIILICFQIIYLIYILYIYIYGITLFFTGKDKILIKQIIQQLNCQIMAD